MTITRYDYERQAWIVDGHYVKCGHPEEMECSCYGRLHEGEEAIEDTEKEVISQ